MGNPVIQTPHLDALAGEGVLFLNNFVATSICPVSRASIFLGQYERAHHIEDFGTPASPGAWTNSYPAVLRREGYTVGFIGKFGLGGRLPVEQFDYWAGFEGQGSYFDDGKPEHLTARQGRQAVGFLKSVDRTRPFCLSISFKAPHAQDDAERLFPPDAREESLYAGVTIPTPRTATDEAFRALPSFIQQSEGRRRWQKRFATPEMFQRTAKDYYRLITGMDREVGNIVATLQTLGLYTNTVIVFTSDNGLFLGEHGLADKFLMYEESIRTPLLIEDPLLPSDRRGRKVAEMTLNVDLAPTLLDLAGVPPPKVMQGHSLVPLLHGETKGWRTDWFYEHLFTAGGTIPQSQGIRTTRWKYVRYIGQDPVVEQLFDLERDPGELKDLSRNPKLQPVLDELRHRWQQLRDDLQ